MSAKLFKYWNQRIPTFGNLAFAAFLIAVLSGIPLSFAYNAGQPLDTLQLLLLTNQAGVYFRSIHYWSGQIFLFATFLHVIEHLWKNSETELKPGLWLRLILVFLFSIFVMLSGFILKADVEGQLARQILTGLLETIPLIGKDLQLLILGNAENLSVLYMHHLITTSFFIGLVAIEHARRVWPELLSYIYLTGISTALAVLLPQGLQLAEGSAVRGPWYFIGLQEILHWISEPLAVILMMTIGLAALLFIRWMSPLTSKWTKRSLLGLLLVYVLLTVNNWGLRDSNWNSLIF